MKNILSSIKTDAAQIISGFEGERKAVRYRGHESVSYPERYGHRSISRRSLNSYATDRQRILAALEYFNEKGWIELQSRQAVEVYDILTQAFNIDDMAEKMYALFKKKGKP